jgi:dTDP-4-dehydrorhamnose reductase
MKKVFITGANGQLGQSLKKRSNDVNADWIFTDVEELDITNVNEVENFFKKNNPDVLVNCAAYTAVDKAEEESVMAEKINCQSSKTLGEYCQKYNCKFIHISTDYVFDGETFEPYRESDIPNPESVKIARKKVNPFAKGIANNC